MVFQISCIQIIVPETLIENAERQWAPREDPVFELVPADCEEHISSVYARLGSPEVNFLSFWQVFNLLHEAVNPDFRSMMDGSVSDGKNMSDRGADADELPLNHLHPCVLGEGDIPPGNYDSNGESGMLHYCHLRFDYRLTHDPEPTIAVEFIDDEENERY